jgi:hypothetical protein
MMHICYKHSTVQHNHPVMVLLRSLRLLGAPMKVSAFNTLPPMT